MELKTDTLSESFRGTEHWELAAVQTKACFPLVIIQSVTVKATHMCHQTILKYKCPKLVLPSMIGYSIM